MSANIKIGNDTLQGVNAVELENADALGSYVKFTLGSGIEGGYTVTFVAEGNPYSIISVTAGSAINEPIPPEVTGVVKGWSTDEAGANLVSFPYTPTADITLYAKVSAVYSITGDYTHCENSNPATTADEGTAYAATITANSGYNFGDGHTLTVTMGGADITSEVAVVSNGTISINIPSVTGDIYINCVAVEIHLTNYILFEGETSDFTLKATNKEWDGTVEYSTDKNTWSTWDGSEIPSANKKLYLRGKNNTKFYTNNGVQFVLSANAGCYGNINTLLDYENPPTAVGENCYRSMFQGCKLTSAPELPATTLASRCYTNMFSGCTSLTTAPELPATTLAGSCYQYMFSACKSLTTAPELPATTLANYCYYSMFAGCTSLKVSETQTEEYATAWRIPSAGEIASVAANWNIDMLKNTGGTFTGNPLCNTTYYGAW